MSKRKTYKTYKTQPLQYNTEQKIQNAFDTLNNQLKQAGYELIIRRPVSKDIVQFDFGLIFTKGNKQAQVYIDEDLQGVIDYFLETNDSLLVKVNWMSPDVVAIGVPVQASVSPLRDTQSDDSIENVVE